MTKLPLFGLIAVLSLGACAPKKSACTYQTDPKGIQIGWTAFKFTEKLAVKGRFNKFQAMGPGSADSLEKLLTGLHMDIDGASVETDNPGRNATIQQFFFEKFNPPSSIHAMATKVEGDDLKGTLTINLKLNGVAKDVAFPYTVAADGTLEAKGTIDMMDFGLQPAFDSLHQACEDLHKGPDGVSKTWTQVDLSVSGKFQKSCS
ncbi:MAG TPA: YceI family protein [bacterium]|nr:YceI family protein [bacterium]